MHAILLEFICGHYVVTEYISLAYGKYRILEWEPVKMEIAVFGIRYGFVNTDALMDQMGLQNST